MTAGAKPGRGEHPPAGRGATSEPCHQPIDLHALELALGICTGRYLTVTTDYRLITVITNRECVIVDDTYWWWSHLGRPGARRCKVKGREAAILDAAATIANEHAHLQGYAR